MTVINVELAVICREIEAIPSSGERGTAGVVSDCSKLQILKYGVVSDCSKLQILKYGEVKILPSPGVMSSSNEQ